MEIYNSVENKKASLKKIINDYTLLADKLIELSVKEVDNSIVSG